MKNLIAKLQLEPLGLEDVKLLVDWAAQEGWNPGAFDALAFWHTDPNGFCGYFLEGNLIAGGAVISYDRAFGFMGLFIVAPGFRNSGIGRKLWFLRRDLLQSRLKPGATIGMDGVVAMQPFYEKGGFKIAFRDYRFECIGQEFPQDASISRISVADFNAVEAYDTACFGVNRSRFLEAWLKMPNLVGFKYVQHNKLMGYALLRKAKLGFKICPLFADNFDVAEKLYQACLTEAHGQAVFIDIPENNTGAQKLVAKYSAKYVFECARMYHGAPLQVASHKIFGITTFELG